MESEQGLIPCFAGIYPKKIYQERYLALKTFVDCWVPGFSRYVVGGSGSTWRFMGSSVVGL